MRCGLRLFVILLVCASLLASPAVPASAVAPAVAPATASAVAPAVAPATASAVAQVQAAITSNLVNNFGFETGNVYPDGWAIDGLSPASAYTWDTDAYLGGRSVKISTTEPTDARWIQVVNVQPNTFYRVSGYIKTENIAHSPQSVDMGATLSLLGTWDEHTPPILGTQDWTYVSFGFNSGERTQVTLALRLGFWSGVTSGTVWFDDVEIAPILPTDPVPSWKILVVIYPKLDVNLTDNKGVAHHYVTEMAQSEIDEASLSATRFVTEDIPALTSGFMVPTITIRIPERTLDTLSPFGDGWWPSIGDVEPERDLAFDSLIVLFDPWVTDLLTGEYTFIGGAAGLTPGMGLGQTYNANIIDSATWYGHRNVFKHEWGHSITSFYEAKGTAPKPAVNNHVDPNALPVHCPTGESYIWEDEVDGYPIPNSVYNNESGFTHDYYSGTVATPDQPTRCLGINRFAWASGGPVSGPLRPALTPEQYIPMIQAQIDQAHQAGLLSDTQAKRWTSKLDAALRSLQQARSKQTLQSLETLTRQVQSDLDRGRVDSTTALNLIAAVQQVIEAIQAM